MEDSNNQSQPEKKPVEVEVVKHGLSFYAADLNDVNCPECESENIVITDEPTVLEFECQKCFCVFRIIRPEVSNG